MTLKVYDARGRLVRKIADGRMAPGVYSEEWDGCDEQGVSVPGGIYFWRPVRGREVSTAKVVLLR